VAETPDADVLDFAHMLFDLARDGDAERLAGYLDAGLSPNLTNDKGDTLLILAAYRGNTETVRTLVDHGADVARANDRGQTALAAAVFKQSEPTVRLLLGAGADPLHGSPNAIDTARFFDLPAMVALIEGAVPSGDVDGTGAGT
jgi:ankyrin repeat protein